MSNYLAIGSEYNGEETVDIIVRPSIKSDLPSGIGLTTTDGANTVKLTYFGPGKHNLVAYSDGFQGGVSSDKIQKKFTLGEFKSENGWSKQDYNAYIQRQLEDVKRAFQNDFFKQTIMDTIPGPDGIPLNTMPEEEMFVWLAEWKIQQAGIKIGIFNNFWLGDTTKLTEEAGTFPNGVAYTKYAADIRFNPVNGVWANIIADAATSPTANQVKKIDMTNSAVAQVDTLTLTGTSGTANVTARGLVKLATFDTNLTTTAANFVTSHAAAYLVVGLTVTSSGADVIFTDAKKGVGFDAVTIANVTGDLAGSRAATTANTAAAAMGTDEAITKMNAMIEGQSIQMKEVPASQKKFYVTRSWAENYQKSLGVTGVDKATSDPSRNVMVNGLEQLRFNGIDIEVMQIDEAISAYFGGYSPHRAILATNDNIQLVLSDNGKFAESALWWEKKDNKVLTRTQLQMGGDYIIPEYLVVAFQD